MTATELALTGGPSVRGGAPWPAWPRYDDATVAALESALRAQRWTVSWPGDGRPSLEREFGRRFAEYIGGDHAVAVDHGSSALVVALELLDIGPGDEVIVPSITWVATASAVLRVGALPVLADVDPHSGCIDPASVEARIGPSTRAVICVHLACTIADLDRLVDLAERTNIHLVEDVAQAHGGTWRGRRLGAWGAVGAFSFQSGNVVVGSHPAWERGQQLRADSRTYTNPEAGAMELVPRGDVIGANRTMSEFHAAILLDRLPHLDAENEYRERQVGGLMSALAADAPWLSVVNPTDKRAQRSVYELALRVDSEVIEQVPVAALADALTAELERPVYPPDEPLFESTLFRPETLGRYRAAWSEYGLSRSFDGPFPGARTYAASTLLIHHSALLGCDQEAQDIAAAAAKVRQAADDGRLDDRGGAA